MAYNKRVWTDRTVERPLTFTLQTNPDGTTTLIPSEGTIITTGTPITAANLNNLEDGVAGNDVNITNLLGRMTTAENGIAARPKFFAEQSDGSFVMQRASNAIYGTLTPNANFLVSVTDTAYSTRYMVFVAHWQYNEILSIHMLASATLTVVQNTLGTISISGNAGTPYFTIMGIT